MEEALDLSFDRLLMMMMMNVNIINCQCIWYLHNIAGFASRIAVMLLCEVQLTQPLPVPYKIKCDHQHRKTWHFKIAFSKTVNFYCRVKNMAANCVDTEIKILIPRLRIADISVL